MLTSHPRWCGSLKRESAHGPAQLSCPSSPWQPWGSQKLLKPWKCFRPGARELAGAPRRGRQSSGCPGIKWTGTHTHNHTYHPHCCCHQWSLDQSSANASICHLGPPCRLPTCCTYFLGNGKEAVGRKPYSWEAPPLLLLLLASGSLGHAVRGGAGCQNSGNCLLSTWACAVGRLGGLHQAWEKGCGLFNGRAVALLLLVLREENWAFGGPPEAGVYSE